MESLYWLTQSLVALPLALWVYFGIGIPFALLVLPRADWQNRVMVICVGFAFAPALLTAWMFILGTIGGMTQSPLLRFNLIFAGTIVLALVGIGGAWYKSKTTPVQKLPHLRLKFDEKLLIGLIALAVILRWFVVAYWPFTAYDTLWVYGYHGRLWFLQGYISPDVGYYPQFLQLQYTFMQLGGGAIDDHAARIVVPFLHLGSILAAYLLGSRLFTRRIGIIVAASWALYPHLAMWSHVGDLEVPLTFLFTATCAFFSMAWTQENRFLRRRYALIAGLLFGIAMWTKPTAGAFILGVMLVVFLDLLRVRFDLHKWYPRFEVALITGFACIPLGAIWYLRNMMLGLPALVFPHSSWLTRATRSGDLLTWPILALFLLIAYLASTRKLKEEKWVLLPAILLILAGAMPSSPQIIHLDNWLGFGLLNLDRLNPPQSRLQIYEWVLIILGTGLSIWHLRQYIDEQRRCIIAKIGWVWLLALPYFITWFWSYSYHARLSFAIVPILILPSAVILAQWLNPENWRFSQKIIWSILLLIISIPGIIVPFYSLDHYHDWLWTTRYSNDYEKYKLHNPGVYLTAEYLWGFADNHEQELVVIAPGEQRLPFFLPEAKIITDTLPTTLDELIAANATHFLYGAQAQWRYENDEGIDPLTNQLIAALGREDLFEQALNFTSGSFRYELYELHLDNWQIAPEDSLVGHLIEDEVIFGEFVRYTGDNVSHNQLVGNRIFIDYLWDVLEQPDGDYLVQLDLLNVEDGQIYYTWRDAVNPHQHGNQPRTLYYSTQVWQVGELIVDRRMIRLPPTNNFPEGNYKLIVNFVDAETFAPLPMTINGEAANGYQMIASFIIRR